MLWDKKKALFLAKLFQNSTIEERVALLEVQMSDVREDLATTDENVADLDQDVNFLFDEQIIQDERLFSLEQMANDVDDNLDLVNEELESKLHGISKTKSFTKEEIQTNFYNLCCLIYFIHLQTPLRVMIVKIYVTY